jgi:hypothetical protein
MTKRATSALRPLDQACLDFHRNVLASGWVLVQEPVGAGQIALYQRLDRGRLERSVLCLRGSVLTFEPVKERRLS